ncbi:MAG: 30S ribosomal protein S4 [Armatimonadota bacterium]
MSVIWTSKCRYCRRAGQKLMLKGVRCHTRKCAMERESRKKPPGQHGEEASRRRPTEYGQQLLEKQKLKRQYLLREKQFSSYMEEASRRRGVTGENLIQLLETRLDNVVFRLGWASSRGQARQMVSHGFFNVNGRRTNVASFQTRSGDVIGLHPSKRDTRIIQEATKAVATANIPSWLLLDPESFDAKVLRLPERDEVQNDINEQLIVEFYTR